MFCQCETQLQFVLDLHGGSKMCCTVLEVMCNVHSGEHNLIECSQFKRLHTIEATNVTCKKSNSRKSSLGSRFDGGLDLSA